MIDVRLPDGSIVSVPTKDPKQAAAAARRHLAYRDASKLRGPYGMQDVAGESVSLGLARPFNAGVYAGTVGLGNAVKKLKGETPNYTMTEAFDAARRVENDKAAEYAKRAPIRNTIGTLIGGFAMPGARQLGALAAGRPGAGLFGQAARASGIGAAMGSVTGMATSDPGKEVDGAKAGALTGGLVGGVAPYVASSVGATGRTVARMANKATGGRLLNPVRQAATRLAETMRADGLDESAVRAGLAEWMRTGSPTPALLDLLPQGGRSRALLRGASSKGGGAQRVVQRYQDQVTADLQGNAIGRTRALTPGEQRPAEQVRTALTDQRETMAAREYAAPYATPIDPSPVQPALQGDAGRRAIAAAYREGDAMSLRPEVADRLPQLRALRAATEPAAAPDLGPDVSPDALEWAQGLLAGHQPPRPADLGTLDRIKIGLNQMGRDAADKGRMGEASGLAQRARMIDDYLAQMSPDYATARTNYASRSSAIDALDVGAEGYRPQTTGQDLRSALDPLVERSADAGTMAGVGYRDAAVRGIGAPTEGATGVLNRLSSSTNQGEVLSELFGPEQARDYQAAIGNTIDQVNGARFLNSGSGSQTAGRLFDETLVEAPRLPKGPMSAIMMAIEKLQAGATLTEQEREALLTLGTSRANTAALDDVGAALSRRLQQGRLAAAGAPISVGLLSRQSVE